MKSRAKKILGGGRMPRALNRSLLLASALYLLIAAPAMAEVEWDVQGRWGPTNLPPGGKGELVMRLGNVGSTDSSGKITVVTQLPPGVSASGGDGGVDTPGYWTCVGTSKVICTTSATVRGRSNFAWQFVGGLGASNPSTARRLYIHTNISPAVASTGSSTITASGGGAGEARSETQPLIFSAEPTQFGIAPSSWVSDAFTSAYPGMGRERQAGTHPFEFRANMDFNLERRIDDRPNGDGGISTAPVDRVRTIETTLPRGLIGNPEAIPECDPIAFLKNGGDSDNANGCPADTQVGYLNLDLGSGGFGNNGDLIDSFPRVAVYKLPAPKGSPIDLGFRAGAYVIGHIYAALDPERDYAIKAISPNNSNLVAARGFRLTLWGAPADPAHDALRARQPVGYAESGKPILDGPIFGAPYPAQTSRPFFTLPFNCGIDDGVATARADSWHAPGQFTPIVDSDQSLTPTGCDDQRLRFTPKVDLQPTTTAASSPTGLDVHLEVPQRNNEVSDPTLLYSESGNQHAIDTPPLKKAVVTLPEGMTISPSAAQGLGSCSSAQIGLGNNNPVACPDSSQYGELTLHTPLLPADQPMHGYIYIAKQNDNPFNNFLSMYFVIEDLQRGLRVKIPGKIDLDPQTGQITTSFDDLPQFPVTDIELSFKSGVRAALVNPATCGRKTITATFYSWHDPNTPITKSSFYDVSNKADGSPCVNNLSERPFHPQLSAGTLSNAAGSYSPFVFRLTRTDDEQEFSQLGVTLPPGLLANISKLSECPEAGIAQAGDPGRTGLAEQIAPSCPASSQLGTTEVGAGVGVPLTFVPGKAYLAGPYRGEPLSMVVISPAVVGPYDLGVIAVRSAIHVDGQRGQATIATDPFPQIFKGIPVRIRDIRVKADRPETMINPTNCNPMAVTAHVTGTGGNLASTADDTSVNLQDRFQAANCASLPFKPKLTFKLKGGNKRGDFPALQATLTGRPGDANIATSTVVLPRSEFIEQGHIRTVCTRPQFASDTCPAGSVYGEAEAKSPLFDEVLKGPVYLRSNGGERTLPDLVVKLNGKIEVVLAGFIDSVGKQGRVRNTFDVVPDAPVTFFKLRMQGGQKGLLVNHLDLCKVTSRATVSLIGQNGKRSDTRPAMQTSCKGKARKAKGKKGHKRAGR
jgi:hypothetical protein